MELSLFRAIELTPPTAVTVQCVSNLNIERNKLSQMEVKLSEILKSKIRFYLGKNNLMFIHFNNNFIIRKKTSILTIIRQISHNKKQSK